MKFRLIAPALAVALLALVSSRADAGLFSHRGHGGCGCEPACGAPAADCCDVGPSSCDSGCGRRHHRGLFSCFKFRRHHLFAASRGCCDTAPACGYAAEPACGIAVDPGCGIAVDPGCGVANEPACGLAVDPGCGVASEAACGYAGEAVCGCEPAADACCAPRRCGLFNRLFSHKARHFGSGCGCAAEPACGYEPACGCN